MTIPAALVKDLRERTGAGMMECKKALQEAGGDIDAAIELMRKSGRTKAAKKAGRIAAEGTVTVQANADATTLVLVEVNCETDFVAKDAGFRSFAEAVTNCALHSPATTVDELLASQLSPANPTTVQESLDHLIGKLGEHIRVRRFERLQATSGRVFSYRHGVRIGVIVEVKGGDESLGRDLAMHIAASNPLCLLPEQVPAATVDKEREIFTAQAVAEAEKELEELKSSGKPQSVIDGLVARKDMVIQKKIEGRIRKFLGEVSLLGQLFVKDPKTTIEKLLQQHKAEVLRFLRMEVGEGIEKKKEDFAAEVAAQVRSL